MALFSGNFQNKLDAKGRVSIPAKFRSILKQKSHAGEDATIATMYLRPSLKHPCIEVWSEQDFEKLDEPLAKAYDQLSDDHEDFAIALFGDAQQVDTDKEGRIVLPPELAGYANLADAVIFIGVRNTFQIWEPQAGLRRMEEARERARTAGFTLRPMAATHREAAE